MDEQEVQRTNLVCHELQNTFNYCVVFCSGNTSGDIVCHEQEGTIQEEPLQNGVGLLSRINT